MKKYVILFIVGIITFGIGCGYVGFEVMSFDYIDEVNPAVKLTKESKEYPIGKTAKYDIDIENGLSKIVIDNTLIDKIQVSISYPSNYFEMFSAEKENRLNTLKLIYNFQNIFNTREVREALDIILKDASDKQFYNYEKTFTPVVEVRVSRENLKYLEIDDDFLEDDDFGEEDWNL